MSTNSQPLIRRAIASDAGLLAALGARTFFETFAADNKPEDMADYLKASFNEEKQATELSNPWATILIAESEGQAVGYAMLSPGETPADVIGEKPVELVRLYVAREWHGLGVGPALMQACIDEARRRQYQTLWLGVWEHNGRAQAFYAKWGFAAVGKHIFQLGSDAQTDILMARKVR